MKYGRLRRQNAFMINRFQPPRTTKIGGATRSFVPRSFGNPMAVTERKYFDTDYGSAIAVVTSTWAGSEADPTTLNTLFCPTTGTDFNNRDGRKVHVVAIRIRGHITTQAQTDQTATDAPSIVRILLVQDQQTNATQLNSEDVLSSSSSSGAINMFQNPAFFGRFRILKDMKLSLANPNITYDGTNLEQQGLVRNFYINIRFKKPKVVHFNSTNGGTVADIIDNSFHIICGVQSNALGPNLAYKSRVVFIDA